MADFPIPGGTNCLPTTVNGVQPKERNGYRWLAGCRSIGLTALGFDGAGSESDAKSVVDSESDDESDDVSEDEEDEEDDEDEEDECEDEVDDSKRFLFLSTAAW